MQEKNTDEPNDFGLINLLGEDPTIRMLVTDIAENAINLSEASTDLYIDHALIRYCTFLSLQPGNGNRSEKFKQDEYVLIRQGFHEKYGDSLLSLILYQYGKIEVLREAIKNKTILSTAPRMSLEKMATSLLKRESDGYLDPDAVNMLKRDIHIGEIYSFENIDSLIRAAIEGHCKMRDMQAQKYREERAKPEDKRNKENMDEYSEGAQMHEIIQSTLESGIHEFRVTPLWGRAIRFLEHIDFKDAMDKGINSICEDKQDATHVALELYGISGIDLETIFRDFDKLKTAYDDDDIVMHESKRLSPNSVNAQKLLIYLFSVNEKIGDYILAELFDTDSSLIRAEGEMDIKSTIKKEIEQIRDNILKNNLSHAHYRNAKRRELDTKAIKLREDHQMMYMIEEIEKFVGLTFYAYKNREISDEERRILNVIGKTKHYLTNQRELDRLLDECKNYNVLILSKDKTLGDLARVLLSRTPYGVIVTDDFDEALRVYEEHKPPFVFIQGTYKYKGESAETLAEFLAESAKGEKPAINIIGSRTQARLDIQNAVPAMVEYIKKAGKK